MIKLLTVSCFSAISFCFTTISFADTAKGEGIYMNFCAACHAAGIAGAPKVGDKTAWQERIAQGTNVLVEHAVNGFQGKTGIMPAKGGHAALTEAEITFAVMYMVDQSQ